MMGEKWSVDLRRARVFAGIAVGAFFVVSLGVVVGRWISSGRVLSDFSISRCVGMEGWSAAVFAVVNIFVVLVFMKYLSLVWREWQLSKWWAGFAILMGGGMIVASLFPYGLFDAYGAGWVSVVHRVGAYMTFGSAVLLALLSLRRFWRESGAKVLRVVGGLFAAYAAACFIMLIFTALFWEQTFWFEAIYIGFVFGVLIAIPEKNGIHQTNGGK